LCVAKSVLLSTFLPFVFSSIQPYPPVAIAVFFKFIVRVERCPSSTLQWSVPHFSSCYKPSPLQAQWGRRCHSCLLQPLFIYSSMRECPSPPLQWSFPHDSHCYNHSPLQGCLAGPTPPPFSGQLLYLQFKWGVPLPHSSELRMPCLFAMCLFFQLLVYSVCFFLFFPWVGVGLSRGLCWSGPGLSVGVPCAT
jgi:hypothetical protein